MRKMDMVTITDHDTIDGALEIAHLPSTFLSEEITAAFPEDRVKVHIVALDITESQHCEIQRLKDDVYELTAFMRAASIPHFVAHPLSGPASEFTPAHVQKLILVFKYLEAYNGTRASRTTLALQRILAQLTTSTIAEWAELHRVEPVSWEPVRYLTGGSDDHGGLAIARAHTEFIDAQPDISSMREAFFSGKLRPAGATGSAQLLGHNIYSVTMKYFQQTAGSSAFNALAGDDAENSELKTNTSGRSARVRDVAMKSIGDADFGLEDLIVNSHTDPVNSAIGELGREIARGVFREFTADLVEGIKRFDLEKTFDAVPGLLTALSLSLPYLFGYRYTVRDQSTAERIATTMGCDADDLGGCRVAIFTDTGFDINGVAIGLRRLVWDMRKIGGDARLVVCGDRPKNPDFSGLEKEGGLKILNPITSVAIPIYSEMKMGVPSLVDVMDYLARENISVVQVSTPGPLGLIALLAAKLCGLPVVANYHTALSEYTARLTGDDSFAALVDTLIGMFYRQADHVIVPSRSMCERVEQFNVYTDRIHLLQRGVETSRFKPTAYDGNMWRRYGLNGDPKLLYVGRISKEKGLDMLIDAYQQVKSRSVRAELVLVGDGPYRAELADKTVDPNVHFLGYQTGEELTKLYASADVFVFPSATDTFGNVVLEAQASGLPAVVVNRGGPANQVISDLNGFVVGVDDSERMAEAIARLVLDEELRQAMGAAARRRALSMTSEKAARIHWEFYISCWRRSLEVDCPEPTARSAFEASNINDAHPEDMPIRHQLSLCPDGSASVLPTPTEPIGTSRAS